MVRSEMLARMSSEELTGHLALRAARAEEARHLHDVAESGDGTVVVYGADDDGEDGVDDGTSE